MKLEAELKVYAEDLKNNKVKLEDEGAEFISEQIEIDTYYSHPARDFGKTDEALRLREIQKVNDGKTSSEPVYELSYKGPKLDGISKSREECAVNINDRGSLERIFSKLGFNIVIVVRKHRFLYKYKNYSFCFDDVEGLGEFIEIEKMISLEQELKSTIDDMRSILIQLFNLNNYERKSYMELIMESRSDYK